MKKMEVGGLTVNAKDMTFPGNTQYSDWVAII